MTGREFRFAIDRGGTFTDVYVERVRPDGPPIVRVLKLLSQDPANYADAPTEGIRRVLAEMTGDAYPRGQPVNVDRVREIRMGTTVATNALLERQGEPTALLITEGFRDLLRIGNQSRPNIFDLKVERPDQLYTEVVEVRERVALAADVVKGSSGREIAVGVTGESVEVEVPLDEAKARADLARLRSQGLKSVAIVLMHAYTFRDHEVKLGAIARELGFEQVSLSHATMPMVKIVPRGTTAAVDAYLTPVLARYIEGFKKGFDEGISKVAVSFMRSDGGLTRMEDFTGHLSILSGPAGGVIGYAAADFDEQDRTALIGFDMGGTSTDVSRFGGVLEHVFETTLAGTTIQSPQLDINTVAAGGGSRLFFRQGQFVVGPESAGAHPGPVSYRKGGYLAVTDANVFLGRVQPDFFPKIFGPGENEALDQEAVRKVFTELADEVNQYDKTSSKTPEEVAYGFLQVANEAMCRPIRNLTTMRGHDTAAHTLSTFGGAGPQHCCAIAQNLGMRRCTVNRFSGILSAYGLSVAEVVEERQRPCALVHDGSTAAETATKKLLDELEAEARGPLLKKHGSALESSLKVHRFLNLRYEGTDTALMTEAIQAGGFLAGFVENYKREFGFVLEGRKVLVDDARVRVVGHVARCPRPQIGKATSPSPEATTKVDVYFGSIGWTKTPLYELSKLLAGHQVPGPALIIQDVATVVVEPGCVANVTALGDLDISVSLTGAKGPQRASPEAEEVEQEAEPIQLSILAHRFMGIAEQMGRTLQRTSVSVNIKERLDFSCALFDPDGGLVANAPHIPVHLGAMHEAVRFQVSYWKDNLHPGDVLVSNHPQLAGGSHLPDITVITPVFQASGEGPPAFFVASRGHHADVGGIAPGSMPPASKSLMDEGCAITSFKLLDRGQFQEKGIADLLNKPSGPPPCVGTRKLEDNLSDLKAQVAANNRGAQLIWELIAEYGMRKVQAYMRFIQKNAENAVRRMLKQFAAEKGLSFPIGSVNSEDFLDDGTRIALKVTVDQRDGSAIFDFSGTGTEMHGNLNAPPAVTHSAVIYCLRCLVADGDIPLNQGCLAPVDVRVPEGTVLNPSAEAAVVGGNVETSQRVTDVVLRAFSACAASQGTMNNLTFGDESFGYYETICGGAGAGPDWDGSSGVHTHMTNTRITDPEILERRYPVLLRRFELRQGSGGAGRRRGGDGVLRQLEFRRPLTVSVLSERRAFPPFGLVGGEDGARGACLLLRKRQDEEQSQASPPASKKRRKEISLGAKNTVEVLAGDVLTLLTPGGGGFGDPESAGAAPAQGSRGAASRAAALLRDGGSVAQYRRDQESA